MFVNMTLLWPHHQSKSGYVTALTLTWNVTVLSYSSSKIYLQKIMFKLLIILKFLCISLKISCPTEHCSTVFLTSISCQLADIRSHSQLSNEQKRCISKQTRWWLVHNQTNTFVCTKSFTRKALAIREKLCPSPSLLINIKSCYKRNGLIGWLFRWLL